MPDEMPGLSHRPGRYALYGPYYRPAACWEIMREGLWAEVAKRHASVLSAMGAIYLSRTGRRGRRGGWQTGRAGVLVRNHLLSAASEARRPRLLALRLFRRHASHERIQGVDLVVVILDRCLAQQLVLVVVVVVVEVASSSSRRRRRRRRRRCRRRRRAAAASDRLCQFHLNF